MQNQPDERDCYEGLYRNIADAEGEHFILAGAERVEVSEDGTVYTFYLRQNVKWSDGQPVTVDDVQAVALDDSTFQVTLKVSDPTFEVKLVATPLYSTRQNLALSSEASLYMCLDSIGTKNGFET